MLKAKEIRKKIAVMLDLEGTIDGINDEKASHFIKQIEKIRKKMKSDVAILSISTHYPQEDKIKKPLEILSRNLEGKVEIGTSFYYGGIYDFQSGKAYKKEFGFNKDKIATFEKYYVDENTKWFAIIDDGIEKEIYQKYKNKYPMVLLSPTKRKEEEQKDNFMSYSTQTKAFSGVIEMLDLYLENIKDMSPEEILKRQKEMMIHISSWGLKEKIRKKEYAYIRRYFEEGLADNGDYETTLFWLGHIEEESLTQEELEEIKRILEIIISEREKKKIDPAPVKSLQKRLLQKKQN